MIQRLIIPEIAQKYDRTPGTIRTQWVPHPAWPAAAGKRGRYKEYDAAEVAAAVATIAGRTPLPDGDPDELLDVARIAAETGLSGSTIRSDISRGRWPAPDDTEHGVHRWKRSTVASTMKGRRRYRHQAAADGSLPHGR